MFSSEIESKAWWGEEKSWILFPKIAELNLKCCFLEKKQIEIWEKFSKMCLRLKSVYLFEKKYILSTIFLSCVPF